MWTSKNAVGSMADNRTFLWKNLVLGQSLAEARQTVKKEARHYASQTWIPASLNIASLGSCVGVFQPQAGWREPKQMPALPQSPQPAVAYPRLEGESLVFHRCEPQDLVFNSRFGIMEPPASAPTVRPTLVLTPALMVDLNGNRIGRGLGFYDRYFAQHPESHRIVVIHSDYVFAQFPQEWIQPWDQKVHGILTETHFIELQFMELPKKGTSK